MTLASQPTSKLGYKGDRTVTDSLSLSSLSSVSCLFSALLFFLSCLLSSVSLLSPVFLSLSSPLYFSLSPLCVGLLCLLSPLSSLCRSPLSPVPSLLSHQDTTVYEKEKDIIAIVSIFIQLYCMSVISLVTYYQLYWHQ